MFSATLSTCVTTQIDCEKYIMDSQIIGDRLGGRDNRSVILQYESGSEWIVLDINPLERFCGYLYLQDALKTSGFSDVEPAENRMAIRDRKIIYLSKYCGEKRPSFFEHGTQIHAFKECTGFKDIAGCANFRVEGDKIYVFDTEKWSFDESVHEKIDSFVHLHDAIRASLEEKLESLEK